MFTRTLAVISVLEFVATVICLFVFLFVCLQSRVFFTNIFKASLNSGHWAVDRMDRSISFEFILLPKELDSDDERNRASSTLVNTLVAFCC